MDNPLESLRSPEGAWWHTFSPGERETLKNKGYVIYALTGEYMYTFGRAFQACFSSSTISNPQADAIWKTRSMLTEVAIDPKNFFLPGSKGKTFGAHLAMVARLEQELNKEMHGVTAIIGKPTDYTELAFLHLAATGEYLFGPTEYTSTMVQDGRSGVVVVGCFANAWKAVHIEGSHIMDRPRTDISVAPLVVPAAART